MVAELKARLSLEVWQTRSPVMIRAVPHHTDAGYKSDGPATLTAGKPVADAPGGWMSDSISVIREFLVSHSTQSVDANELDRSRDLLDEGVIDSLGLMELVEFLSKRFALEFEPSEIVPANFKTLASIGALVDGKLQRKE